MSREPIRLVDLRDPPSPKAAYMRDVIRAQLSVRPPEGKMEELAGRLAPILRSSPPPVRSTPWLGLAVAAVTTIALVGLTLSTRDTMKDAPPGASAPAQTKEPLPTPHLDPVPPPVQAVPVEALPSAEVRKAPPSLQMPAPAASALHCDDVMLVDAADTALRAGKPEAALAAAREHERRCPTGALVQERERIAIEALVQLGRIDQARARARVFEERFPSSPHVGRIQQSLERHPR